MMPRNAAIGLTEVTETARRVKIIGRAVPHASNTRSHRQYSVSIKTILEIAPLLAIGFLVIWVLLLFQSHMSLGDVFSSTELISVIPNLALRTRNISGNNYKQQQQQQQATKQSPLALENNIKSFETSPYFGWQPQIYNESDCQWRQCFHAKHGCRTTCRDEPLDSPPHVPIDWIPDVTMLRRMFLAQVDYHGNPWPPPLPRELCQRIGVNGGNVDENKDLIDAAPIVARPLLPSQDSTSQYQKQRSNQTIITASMGPKILCMIYTMSSAHPAQVRAIRETWAGGCDGFLAFSTETDPRIPAISIPHDGPESYNNMWQKVRSIWRFVGKHYANDFDFFFLGGDDLFVLPQNLRSYLATLGDPDQLLFAGRRFKGYGKDNYFNSGGAGYTLSRGTLKQFVSKGLDDPRCSPEVATSMEDVMIAQCLRRVFGIGLTDTRDDNGRERFHPFSPGTHYHWSPPSPGGSDWYQDYNQEWGIRLGAECCAPDSVSFHYLKKPAMIRHVFMLLYGNCTQS